MKTVWWYNEFMNTIDKDKMEHLGHYSKTTFYLEKRIGSKKTRKERTNVIV